MRIFKTSLAVAIVAASTLIGCASSQAQSFTRPTSTSGSHVCTGYGYQTGGRTVWLTVHGEHKATEAEARASAQRACSSKLNACRITCFP